MDVTRRRKMKMAVYMAMDGNGERVNLVEIEEGQVMGWERATEMKLVKVEEGEGRAEQAGKAKEKRSERRNRRGRQKEKRRGELDGGENQAERAF